MLAGPGVRGRPATVLLRALHLGDAGRMHAPFGREPLGDAGVPLRPGAALAAGREALTVRGLVPAAYLAVDPAVTERLLERLVVRQARRLERPLLGEHEPDAALLGVIRGEPAPPRRGVENDQLRRLAQAAMIAADDPRAPHRATPRRPAGPRPRRRRRAAARGAGAGSSRGAPRGQGAHEGAERRRTSTARSPRTGRSSSRGSTAGRCTSSAARTIRGCRRSRRLRCSPGTRGGSRRRACRPATRSAGWRRSSARSPTKDR